MTTRLAEFNEIIPHGLPRVSSDATSLCEIDSVGGSSVNRVATSVVINERARALSGLRRRLDLLISELASCVVSIDPDGQIRFATGGAVERIETYLGDQREPDRLPAVLDTWRAEQLRHRFANRDDVPMRVEPFVRDRDRRRLVVRHLFDEDGSLLLVEELPLAIDASGLVDLGLTPREGQILSLVAVGRTNVEVSVVLKVSARTVEKHLEHVYAKLGVANRAAAVAVAFVCHDHT